MKLTGITGSGTGRLGSSVFAVNSGVQIVRQYQPVVANPSTVGQVEQRAKLKLASQLARDLKQSIAIPRSGLVSSRNLFMKKNFDFITYSSGSASVNLDAIQLTNSNASFGSIDYIIINDETNKVLIKLAGFSAEYFDGISVHVYRKNADNSLSFVKATDLRVDGDFDADTFTLKNVDQSVIKGDIFYIYAFSTNNVDAKAKYQDMVVNEASTIASLLTSRSITESDVTLTKTLYKVAET